jgi:ketosteroid isomerase-like protein
MSATENKKVMETVMAALARGDGRPFVDAMAEDFAWTFPGGGVWSGTWKGKERVRKELLGPLFAQFQGRYTNHAIRLVAEDDIVVVECRGEVRTKDGQEYNNAYCYVCRFEGGRLKELTEYMDTALAERVLAPPVRSADE